MKTLTLLFLILSPGFAQVEGCTDPLAYSCEMDTIWSNYIFDIGGIKYDNSCNWDWDNINNEPIFIDACVEGVCESVINENWDVVTGEGYYNPNATADDGSCRYYQAPGAGEIEATIADSSIQLDWSNFLPPELGIIEGFHVQRCGDDGCTWLPGYTPASTSTETNVLDEFNWESGVPIKYAIAVSYESNPYFGYAIEATYITPIAGCTDPESEYYDPEANFDDGSCSLVVNNIVLPNDLEIKSLYPNPFNPEMNIEFEISKFQEIHFKVVDLNGRQVVDKILGSFNPGNYQFTWQPENFNSGMYFISLGNKETAVTKKVVFLK